MHKLYSSIGLIALLSACSQPPARVEDNGKNDYKQRDIMLADAAASSAPVSAPLPVAPQSTISVQSFESKDLNAITPAAGSTNNTFKMPVEGKVISRFGEQDKDGIRIAAPAGTPVRAASSGEVVFAGNQLKTYGNMVIVKHANRRTTTYSHLAKTFVSKGDRVMQGDTLGTVGKTGNVTTPQLHFALREGTEPTDPMQYIPTATSQLQ
jgi:murein DD-endopeptidase MepM/ murein hydrolase activator NlpD